MNKIKENLQIFFIFWGVVLLLNQVILFHGCFKIYCLIAALPHTGLIAFLVSIFAITSNAKEVKEKKTTNFEENKRKKQNEMTISERIKELDIYLERPVVTKKPSQNTKAVQSQPQKPHIATYEDKELQNLRNELKSLNTNLQTIIQQKQEYLNNIDEFNNQYNLHLVSIIENILNLKKEILYKQTIEQNKLKELYKKDAQTHKETQNIADEIQTNIDELEDILKNINQDDEQYDEIYQSYQQVQEELEKLNVSLNSQKQNLNDTKKQIEDDDIFEEYEEAKQNYELYHQVQKNNIQQNNFKNNITLGISIDFIEDKELLKAKIKEFKNLIKELQKEIEDIKTDDTFVLISKIDDWDDYFEGLKNELQKEKDKLKVEASEILEEKNEVQKPKKRKPKTIKKITLEDSPYSSHIQSIKNSNFEKIRRYCENLAKENQADEMQKYLAQNGKMHKALIYSTMETFIERVNNQTITLIDWGCDQGIASMLVLDYIKEKQIDVKVDQILLIDSDDKTLSRAMASAKALDFYDAKIEAFNIKNNSSNILKSIKNSITLNLFANDKLPLKCSEINLALLGNSYFLSVSNEDKKFVDQIYEDISENASIEDISIRDGKIGRFAKFERIFKIKA